MILFLYLVVRLQTVIPVGDEAVTYFWYIQHGYLFPPYPHVDANNHLLITLIGHWIYGFLGDSIWTLRVPALIFFPLFSVYVFLWGRRIPNVFGRWSWYVFALCTPFFLEFFALGRGYGPSLALLLGGIYHLGRAVDSRKGYHLVVGYLFFFLGSLANLNLLPILGLSIFFTTFSAFHKGWRSLPVWVWAIPALGGLIWLGEYGLFLQGEGLLYYKEDSWFSNSLPSIGVLLFPQNASAGVLWILILALLCLFIGGLIVKKIGLFGSFGYIPFWTLSGTVFYLSISHLIFDTGLPLDRTAIHLVFLLGMTALEFTSVIIGKLSRYSPLVWILIASPGLWLVTQLNGTHSVVWPQQHIPRAWIDHFQPSENTYPPTLSGYFYKSRVLEAIGYFDQLDLASLNPNEMDTNSTWKILEDATFFPKLSDQYGLVDEDPINGSLLLRRKIPLKFEEWRSETVNFNSSTAEAFLSLLSDTLPVTKNLVLELNAEVSGLRHSGMDLDLVIQCIGPNGEQVGYESIFLNRRIQPEGNDEVAYFTAYLSVDDCLEGEVRVHIFNPHEQTFFPGTITTRLLRTIGSREINKLHGNPQSNGT